MKILLPILAILATTTIFAAEQKIDFSKYTSEQIAYIERMDNCLAPEIKTSICVQYREYKEKRQKVAFNEGKHFAKEQCKKFNLKDCQK